MGILHDIQPEDREPVDYTHFCEWFADKLPSDASDSVKLDAFHNAPLEKKVEALEGVLASWESTTGVPLPDMDGFDDLFHMVSAVGFDNVINLCLFAILGAEFDVYVGDGFIEIYAAEEE